MIFQNSGILQYSKGQMTSYTDIPNGYSDIPIFQYPFRNIGMLEYFDIPEVRKIRLSEYSDIPIFRYSDILIYEIFRKSEIYVVPEFRNSANLVKWSYIPIFYFEIPELGNIWMGILRFRYYNRKYWNIGIFWYSNVMIVLKSEISEFRISGII